MRQWEKGYIAGVIDSDGCIAIRPIHGSYSFSFHIQIVGTREQVEKLRAIVPAGNVYSHGSRWRWILGRKQDVLSLLKRIYPYLTKKPEANLVFKMVKLHRANGQRKSEENFNARFKIFQQYKALKCRNGGSDTNWGEFKENLRQKCYGNPEPSSISDREGAETKGEITSTSAPLEREEIVQA